MILRPASLALLCGTALAACAPASAPQQYADPATARLDSDPGNAAYNSKGWKGGANDWHGGWSGAQGGWWGH
jgi:hypothetical protein